MNSSDLAQQLFFEWAKAGPDQGWDALAAKALWAAGSFEAALRNQSQPAIALQAPDPAQAQSIAPAPPA